MTATTTRPARQTTCDAHRCVADGSPLLVDKTSSLGLIEQGQHDTEQHLLINGQGTGVIVNETALLAVGTESVVRDDDLGIGQVLPGGHDRKVADSDFTDERHTARVDQVVTALVGEHPPPADHAVTDAQRSAVGGGTPMDTHNDALTFAVLRLDLIESQRTATANRMACAIDPRRGGHPALVDSDEYLMLAAQTGVLADADKQATKVVERAMKAHPLRAWVDANIGIGYKQAARLIVAMDCAPHYNHAADRIRRGPAELWAYCGYAPDQKRRKGVKSNWNPDAKMRAFLCAESCIKQARSPFRATYDAARASWADRDTSDGHKHNHALRCVAKALLADLWRTSIDMHEAGAI